LTSLLSPLKRARPFAIKYSLKTLKGVKMGGSSNHHPSVGFVPTMGALHQGHLSLVQRARSENDITVASIFVNPKQFGPDEDLDKYPRTFQADCKKLKEASVDLLFAPSTFYEEDHATFVDIEGIDTLAEGKSRPGHFRGVLTVVLKLFNTISPTSAYFGQKDGLQCIAISQMVRDLNVPVQVQICPTVREEDGLAMSSRNVYLTPEQRSAAPIVQQALLLAQVAYERGERNVQALRDTISAAIETKGEVAVLDYVSVADARNGHEVEGELSLQQRVMVSIVVKFGKTRLLDNLLLPSSPS
jgi:pantoate--beta-alanine ligase